MITDVDVWLILLALAGLIAFIWNGIESEDKE